MKPLKMAKLLACPIRIKKNEEKVFMQHRENKSYITTAIYYANAKPHVGSLYEIILADVAARWARLCGKKTFFLTGLDEHGQKIADAAAAAGKDPQSFVDAQAEHFVRMWHAYDCSYDQYIRTTAPYHKKAVQIWLNQLIDQGDVYKSTYSGWYCQGEESFITEKDLVFKDGADVPVCGFCGRPTKKVEEEGYFFRLSAYQDRLLDFLKKNPEFIVPKERAQEVISFIESGLKDLSVSRSRASVSWGIPFPGDDTQVAYVWADALCNYLSAIGFGDEARKNEFDFWWPADVQVIGKDIVRFHAIYWLAFLLASGLPLPKHLLVHGWLTLDGQKMSKSLGNVVDPFTLHAQYGSDVVRYYLARYMVITQDSPFGIEDLENRATTDLANDLGNLFSRVAALAHKYRDGRIQAPAFVDAPEKELKAQLQETLVAMTVLMKDLYFSRAYARLWTFIQSLNAYVQQQTPWTLAKQNPERFDQVMSALAHCLHAIAVVTEPIIPQSSQRMCELLNQEKVKAKEGVNYVQEHKERLWTATYTFAASESLFKKYDSVSKTTVPEIISTKVVSMSPSITFDHFVAVELRVGLISAVEHIEKSDKLYKLTVDFGEQGMRTVCSGIKKFYTPDELLNQKVVFAFNLAPRALMGIESHGMILTAKDVTGKPLLIKPAGNVFQGTLLS